MVDEIDLDPSIEEPEIWEREVKVQHTGRQYTLPLPMDFIDVMDLQKGDVFIISVPLKNKKGYSIKLKEKNGKRKS